MNTTRNNAVDGKSSEKFYPKKKTLQPLVDEACNLSVAYNVLQIWTKKSIVLLFRKIQRWKKCCREMYCTIMYVTQNARRCCLYKKRFKKPLKWQDDSNFHSRWDLLSHERCTYSHTATFHKEITNGLNFDKLAKWRGTSCITHYSVQLDAATNTEMKKCICKHFAV